MSQKFITMDDRNKIEILHEEGYLASKIKSILGYHHSSISRDLERRASDYTASIAHCQYLTLSNHKGRKSKLTSEIKESIEKI